MLKYLGICITIIFTSFFFFPFEFVFLSGANTKMIMAGLGLVILGCDLARKRKSVIDKDFFVISLMAALVSLVGFIAVVINGTSDFTYASYVVSMWVWVSAAYMVTRLMKQVHGSLSLDIVCNYLIVVCALQCVIALMMDNYLPLKSFVDSFLAGTGFMGKGLGDRIYGIGANLDVAGMRFAAILCMISYLTVNARKSLSPFALTAYLTAYFIIAVIGNMIGRTTIVGVGLSLAYWGAMTFSKEYAEQSKRLWKFFGVSLLVFIPIVVVTYNTNPSIHSNIRFAFEGFFSLFEKGTWEVHSNGILKNMVVFPDNTRTWLIGDGYFDNPYHKDPYYIGEIFHGFYKQTDIGYLRFIFYFGLAGLIAFSAFMIKSASVIIQRIPQHRVLISLMLILNFIVWFKVSSDLFLIFAIFLCVSKEEQEPYNQSCHIQSHENYLL